MDSLERLLGKIQTTYLVAVGIILILAGVFVGIGLVQNDDPPAVEVAIPTPLIPTPTPFEPISFPTDTSIRVNSFLPGIEGPAVQTGSLLTLSPDRKQLCNHASEPVNISIVTHILASLGAGNMAAPVPLGTPTTGVLEPRCITLGDEILLQLPLLEEGVWVLEFALEARDNGDRQELKIYSEPFRVVGQES
jgi:hypothetical protein